MTEKSEVEKHAGLVLDALNELRLRMQTALQYGVKVEWHLNTTPDNKVTIGKFEVFEKHDIKFKAN